jgi:hypothetical protein
MPALVNSRVGSLRGTSGEDGTTLWPRSAKNQETAADVGKAFHGFRL